MLKKLSSSEQVVRGLWQVERNLMETIQDTVNRSGFGPIQDVEYAANLQAKEELQRVTLLLGQAREEESQQRDMMISLRQDAQRLSKEAATKEI
eukprot:2449485-Prorocentrum_lima.AAC.1